LGDCFIAVNAAGFARHVLAITIGQGQTIDQNLLLGSSLSLSGIVRDEVTGEPIPDAIVRLTSAEFAVDDPGLSASTDNAGEYTVEGIEPGTYVVYVQASSYAAVSTSLEVTASTTLDFGISASGYWLDVHVIDAGTSLPVATAWVTVTQQGNVVASVESDADGMVEVGPLTAGSYDVIAYMGMCQATESMLVSDNADLNLVLPLGDVVVEGADVSAAGTSTLLSSGMTPLPDPGQMEKIEFGWPCPAEYYLWSLPYYLNRSQEIVPPYCSVAGHEIEGLWNYLYRARQGLDSSTDVSMQTYMDLEQQVNALYYQFDDLVGEWRAMIAIEIAKDLIKLSPYKWVWLVAGIPEIAYDLGQAKADVDRAAINLKTAGLTESGVKGLLDSLDHLVNAMNKFVGEAGGKTIELTVKGVGGKVLAFIPNPINWATAYYNGKAQFYQKVLGFIADMHDSQNRVPAFWSRWRQYVYVYNLYPNFNLPCHQLNLAAGPGGGFTPMQSDRVKDGHPGLFLEGDDVHIWAGAVDGYDFDHWEGLSWWDSIWQSRNHIIMITMDQDYNIRAFFKQKPDKQPDPDDEEQDSATTHPKTSISPEDKWGPAGYDAPETPAGSEAHFILPGETFDYRIEMWNKPEAPVPTQDAVIYDYLDPNVFDLSTFEFTRVGFLKWDVPLPGGQTVDVRVDCLPDMNLAVEIKGTFDPETGRIEWWFHSIDPMTGDYPEDPNTGFLPPFNPQTGFEIGWMEFRVKPKENLPTGTQIANQAFVQFDFLGPWGPAPKEGPWINTIDAGAPTSQVNQLAPESAPTFEVSWNGADDPGGSGVAYYDIYVSDNSGPFLRWLQGTSLTTGTFTGEAGHSYAFYSIAVDNVGNTEAAPGEPDATTTVVAVPGITLNLKAGWNMVSAPLTLGNNSVSAVFPGVAAVYTWDPVSRSYIQPDTIEPDTGYWVAVTADGNITVTGTPVTTWTSDMTAGWNMIGSVSNAASIANPNDSPDASVQPFAYWWDPVNRTYILTTDIDPGKGYWVASVRDGTLTLP
jgi:hypothetical protein